MKNISRRKFAAFLAGLPFVGSIFASTSKIGDNGFSELDARCFVAKKHGMTSLCVAAVANDQSTIGGMKARQAVYFHNEMKIGDVVRKLRLLADTLERGLPDGHGAEGLCGNTVDADSIPYLEDTPTGNLGYVYKRDLRLVTNRISGEAGDRSATVVVFNKDRTQRFVLQKDEGNSFIGTFEECEEWKRQAGEILALNLDLSCRLKS